MYSFQAKIGLKKLKKGKNKNYRSIPLLNDAKLKILKKIAIKLSFRSYTTRNRKFLENRKNIQKIKKYLHGFLSSQNRF